MTTVAAVPADTPVSSVAAVATVAARYGNRAKDLVGRLQRKRLAVRAVLSVCGFCLIGAPGPVRAIGTAFATV